MARANTLNVRGKPSKAKPAEKMTIRDQG